MTKYQSFKIAVCPGDGIGPEVMEQALKVLQTAGRKYSFSYDIHEAYIGGAAFDRFKTPLPEETQQLCLSSDAVLLGSIGGPQWDHLPPPLRPESGGLLELRKSLQLYANLRPVKLFKSLLHTSPLSPGVLGNGIDLLTVRELASGIYFGQPKNLTADEGLDTMVYHQNQVERIAKLAFQQARQRGKKVTSVDKANVLHSSMLWRRVVSDVAKGFPDVKLEHMYVDNAAMQLVLNPARFDVILTTNLFGDILSDESAAICGSLGMLPSASLGDSVHLYEPAGGSAPDIAGKDIANPIAQILSAAMMLDISFNLKNVPEAIFSAVGQTLQNGYATRDIATNDSTCVSTRQMGDLICEYI